MTIVKRVGMLLAALLACAAANAQVTCAQCKAAALADASQCRAQAAPDVELMAICDRKYVEMGHACQEVACRVDSGAAAAAQCADCMKQADVETKKCAGLPPEVRAACEARVASVRKSCYDKACPAAKK